MAHVRRTTRDRLIPCLMILSVALIGAVPLAAQFTTASLDGTVVDPSGAAVPDASIRMENTETGLIRNTRSGPDGHYLFPALPVGVYKLTVEKSGFPSLHPKRHCAEREPGGHSAGDSPGRKRDRADYRVRQRSTRDHAGVNSGTVGKPAEHREFALEWTHGAKPGVPHTRGQRRHECIIAARAVRAEYTPANNMLPSMAAGRTGSTTRWTAQTTTTPT